MAAANLHAIPPRDEHHRTSAAASPPPLTTPNTTRECPPPAIKSMPDSSYLNGNWAAAFALHDASCINSKAWPPRSYPCSFCKREFRSAQALGGHMNVHRRDRARLHGTSPPNPSYLRDHNAASHPNHQPFNSQQADSYQSPLTLSLMEPAVSSDSLSCKITISNTVPILITTSPFMSNSSSPAVVYDPSHNAPSTGSSTTSASICLTLSEPATPAAPPPPQSLPLTPSSSLIPLEGQTNTPRNFPPSCRLDASCSLTSNLSLIHLKCGGSTRKKSIPSLGCRPYPSLSFKRMDKSHASSRSDVGKGTIGNLDLELRLGQSS